MAIGGVGAGMNWGGASVLNSKLQRGVVGVYFSVGLGVLVLVLLTFLL